MKRRRKPPSQTWRTFLSDQRRKVVHFDVTESPSASWAGQRIIEAFPVDTAPRYMLRDSGGIYGLDFARRVGGMGTEEVVISARSPWQNPYVERRDRSLLLSPEAVGTKRGRIERSLAERRLVSARSTEYHWSRQI